MSCLSRNKSLKRRSKRRFRKLFLNYRINPKNFQRTISFLTWWSSSQRRVSLISKNSTSIIHPGNQPMQWVAKEIMGLRVKNRIIKNILTQSFSRLRDSQRIKLNNLLSISKTCFLNIIQTSRTLS
jgi:hypothetical protein